MTATCHNPSCPISLFEHTEGHGECVPAPAAPTVIETIRDALATSRVSADPENTRPIRWESELDVSPDIRHSEVEYGTDGAGRRTYRHVRTTEWRLLPDA